MSLSVISSEQEARVCRDFLRVATPQTALEDGFVVASWK